MLFTLEAVFVAVKRECKTLLTFKGVQMLLIYCSCTSSPPRNGLPGWISSLGRLAHLLPPWEGPSTAERGPAEEGSLSTPPALPSKDSVGTERTGDGQTVCFSGKMPVLDTKVVREGRATSQHHPQPSPRPGCVAFTRTTNPPHQHLWVPWHKMLLQNLLLQYSPSQQRFGHRTPMLSSL